MLGEASTTEIARRSDALGFDENRTSAKQGGTIAGNARKALEAKTGKKVVSKANYLAAPTKPDLLADIKNGHNEVYEKRHQRIEEKKAVLLVQEQAKQEAEQSDKQQSEAGMQTEEQPQEEDIAA